MTITGYKEVNEKYRCTSAKTDFYEKDAIYQGYQLWSGSQARYVQGSDGIMDKIGYTVSTFKKVTPNEKPK